MSTLVLAPAERALFEALQELGLRFLLVGMGAALLEGAPGTTQDLDIWFGSIDPERVAEAARRAGGFYSPGFGLLPPTIGGDGLERIDLVSSAVGLDAFDVEFDRAPTYEIDGIPIRVLSLDRVIASKRAANRPKDRAQLPALEAALAARREP